MSNVAKVESRLLVQPEKVFTSFNLMSQILPSREPFPNGRHYDLNLLDFGSLEFKIIANLFNRTFTQAQANIESITKLRNTFVQEKFMTEFKLLATKYKGKGLTQLVKLLFHGAKGVSPEMVYESETGLDTRFSRDGNYGQGIYFADNADYSHAYAWTEQ